MQENIISIRDLSKTYGSKVALDKISIDIPKGSICGLIGQNGAGKTSLIRILNQIISKDSGSIFFKGIKINNDTTSLIGYLPEERGLYKNMSIEEQALYFGQLKGMSKKKSLIQLNYWLNKFDIIDWKKKKIQSLSKGMAQKVQFVMTVLHQPELLILDEPFSGFDPINANIIGQEIKELALRGTTIIFSSHRMESVSEMCDTLYLIHQGKILLSGDIEEIQKSYGHKIYKAEIINHNKSKWIQFNENPNYSIKINSKKKDGIYFEVINYNQETNHLLKDLVDIGQVISFHQYLPSLQDIFIKTIENA